jgi:hypothetical protein
MSNTLDEILAARAHPHDVKAATRPLVQLQNPNVHDAILAGLRAVKADIVVDDNGYLVATYDGHVRRLENNHQRCDCLEWHLDFMRGAQRVGPSLKLAREFFSRARELGWFRHEHRGPCPACAAKSK